MIKTKKSKILGLYYTVKTISGCKYLELVHEKSGIPLLAFPGPVAKISDVIAFSEEHFKSIPWNIEKSEMTEAHEKAYTEARRRLTMDSKTGIIILTFG